MPLRHHDSRHRATTLDLSYLNFDLTLLAATSAFFFTPMSLAIIIACVYVVVVDGRNCQMSDLFESQIFQRVPADCRVLSLGSSMINDNEAALIAKELAHHANVIAVDLRNNRIQVRERRIDRPTA